MLSYHILGLDYKCICWYPIICTKKSNNASQEKKYEQMWLNNNYSNFAAAVITSLVASVIAKAISVQRSKCLFDRLEQIVFQCKLETFILCWLN